MADVFPTARRWPVVAGRRPCLVGVSPVSADRLYALGATGVASLSLWATGFAHFNGAVPLQAAPGAGGRAEENQQERANTEEPDSETELFAHGRGHLLPCGDGPA